MSFPSLLTSVAPYPSTASPMPSPSFLGSSQASDAAARETTRMLMHTQSPQQSSNTYENKHSTADMHKKLNSTLNLSISDFYWATESQVFRAFVVFNEFSIRNCFLMFPRDNLKLNFVLTQLFC